MGSDKQEEVDDASALPPPKRHQQSAGRPYIPPQDSRISLLASQPDNRQRQPHKAKDTSPIKTPRPDITTGIKESAVISALPLLSCRRVSTTPRPRPSNSSKSFSTPQCRAGGMDRQNRYWS